MYLLMRKERQLFYRVRNMRDPVTLFKEVYECSHEKITAVLNVLIKSNKFVRQSRHIGALTKAVFVVRVGFLPIC